jgi:FMN phosphatase YigB (HAD superfamily)
MRIAFDVDNVLRDTFLKAEQIYQKHYIDEFINEETSSFNEEKKDWVTNGETEPFEYKLNLPIKDLNQLEKHFIFPTKEEIFNFFYVDFPMQIFGNSPSMELNTFNYLNDIYEKLRDKHDIIIVSDEIQKSKPATLFFLSKYGCLVEKLIFFSNVTINNLWNDIDILVTANPILIKNKPENKIIVKYNSTYNTDINCNYEINSLNDFKDLYKKLKLTV